MVNLNLCFYQQLMTRTTMKNILPLRCWLLFPLVSAVHVWDYGEEG